jgi:class 3 adenylate cyclase
MAEQDEKSKLPYPWLASFQFGDKERASFLAAWAELAAAGLPTLDLSRLLAGHPSQQIAELQRRISELRQEYSQAIADLQTERGDRQALQATVEEQRRLLGELQEKQRLLFLLSSVDEGIHPQLLTAEPVKRAFLSGGVRDSFVMSVDIRRSTELMLKAREPQRYADFIARLCDSLTRIVKQSYGVFDKFTGDGVLAFYPDFFSGPGAGFRALEAASECHRVFEKLYKDYRSCFNSILSDAGLGIGIDYGPVHLVRVSGGITVVGEAVVYACRMGGAPAGKTFINQPAYEQLSTTQAAHYSFRESEIEIKHEGRTLAYEVIDTGTPPELERPAWLQQQAAAAPAVPAQTDAAAAAE